MSQEKILHSLDHNSSLHENDIQQLRKCVKSEATDLIKLQNSVLSYKDYLNFLGSVLENTIILVSNYAKITDVNLHQSSIIISQMGAKIHAALKNSSFTLKHKLSLNNLEETILLLEKEIRSQPQENREFNELKTDLARHIGNLFQVIHRLANTLTPSKTSITANSDADASCIENTSQAETNYTHSPQTP